MTNKYILGGGIAGLIFAFYNKNFKIISEDIGGQMKNNFSLGPRLLEDNKYSRKLLTDLKIKIVPEKIKVGFFYDSELHSKPNKNFLKEYFLKSRGIKHTDQKFVLNNNKTEMKILKINFEQIIEKLKTKLFSRIISEKILTILDKTILTNKNEYKYKTIVNTIPLNIFLGLYGRYNKNYFSESVTYVLLKKEYFDFKQYDFIYFCGNELFYRLSQTDDNKIVAEIKKEISENKLKKIFGKFLINFKVLKNSQIVSGPAKEKINENIFCFGRYGTWNRKYKTDTIIKGALAWQKKE
jgi:hypothetical protein